MFGQNKQSIYKLINFEFFVFMFNDANVKFMIVYAIHLIESA